MAKIYVYSTLTCDNEYHSFVQGGADLPMSQASVLIKGGAGVANNRVVTPQGVRTEITEQDLEVLRSNKVFELHEQNGFVKVEVDLLVDADVVAADMASRDGGAPVVPQDLPTDDLPMGDPHKTAKKRK